jgi:tripartite-type tricarboxylate transporter receptor subunit TctC
MTLTGMKKHVDVLEQAGLVTTRKVGRVRTCRLGLRGLEEEAAWIERRRQIWNERFNALETVDEALGLKGFEAYAWQVVVVPTKTPDPIVAKLTERLAGALQQEAVRTRMKDLDPLSGGPAEFQALLESERDVRWPVIRDPGLSLE